MSEKVAVIASILKPVDDTRMYEKLALSISETKKYRVNIIGFAAKNPPIHPGMEFHQLYRGKRTGLGRLLVPFRFFIKLLKIKPDLVIICTPELLLPAGTYKLFHRPRIWYDIQENYQRNVKYQHAYLWAFKPFLIAAIWLTENISRLFVDHYLLAERGYAGELNFVNGRHTILENKFVGLAPVTRPRPGNEIKMIFTGTCSRENGILEAISLVTSLHQSGYPVKLTIAGQIPDTELLFFIKTLQQQLEFLVLVGDGSLVSHSNIMESASKADFGLVAHQPNPSNQNCIPTKIYEYLGLQLPMILQTHPLWESIVKPYAAAVVLDFKRFQPPELWQRLHETEFYTTLPGPEITWQQEARKLLLQL